MMCFRGMSYLPVLLVLLTTTTVVVTYIMAILDKDVTPYFPYISDTGTKPPESCVFSQFLNMSAAICLCTMYVRYKLVEKLGGEEDGKLRTLNKIGLVLGIFSSIGLSLVANFQETNIEPVHVTGAFLVFGIGVIYTFIQTILSYHMYPDFNGLRVCRVRMVISVLALICMVMTVVSAVFSRYQKDPNTDKLHWKPDEAGFTAHLISTFGEWFTAIIFLFFFFTFVKDFQKLKFDVTPVLHVRHLEEDPNDTNERTRLIT